MGKFTRKEIQHKWDLALVESYIQDRSVGFAVRIFLDSVDRGHIEFERSSDFIRRLKLKRASDFIPMKMSATLFVHRSSPSMGRAMDNAIIKNGVSNFNVDIAASNLKRFKWSKNKKCVKIEIPKYKKSISIKARSLSANWNHTK